MSNILDENIKGYCHLCGAAIHVDMEEIEFCPYCGKRIKPEVTTGNVIIDEIIKARKGHLYYGSWAVDDPSFHLWFGGYKLK